MFNLSLKNGLVRNTIWMFLGQGLRLVIQALYFVEIARSLGAANYGAFIGVVALVGIAFPFGALGSGNLLVKNVARDRATFPIYWGRALAVTGASSSLFFVVLATLSHIVLPAAIPLRLVLLVAGADLFGLNIITVCGQAFQAFEQLNWTAVINVLISFTRLIGAVILIRIHAHPSALQWGYVYFLSTAAVAATALAPKPTRQSLLAQRLVMVFFPANALWNRQLVLGPPRQQPRLHVLVLDVMSRFDLAIRLTDLGQHPFLIGDVGFHGVRDQKIRTASRGLRQPGQPFLGFRLQPDAQGRAPCVCHEHILTLHRGSTNSLTTMPCSRTFLAIPKSHRPAVTPAAISHPTKQALSHGILR